MRTHEQIAAECERLFQNGGTKVYLHDPIADVLSMSALSATRTVRSSLGSQAVWARQKVRGTRRYAFQCIKASTWVRVPNSKEAGRIHELALMLAIEAPLKRNQYAVSATVTWDTIDELRGIFAELGYDVQALVRKRMAINSEARGKAVAARQARSA